jgi:signal transduction histidine kinase
MTGRRLGLAGRHAIGARRRSQVRNGAGTASAAGALLELLVRGLELDRAAFLVEQRGALRPVATWGAVRLPAIESGGTPPDGPWSAALPITHGGRAVGLALLANRGARPLAPAARAVAVRMLTGVGAMLDSGALVHEAARADELLARADRLAVLGTLAASIAHEIRNPLVAVRTFIELLPERLHDEEFRTDFRQLTLAEIERVCGLLNDLLAFTRPSPAGIEPSDLNALAMQTVRLLEPEARKRRVSIRVALDDTLSPVSIDEGRAKQVLMNLILNAIEACAARGTVDVATSMPAPGAWSVLEVADDGVGVPDALAPHVFDPFVTTKDTGSGLGLHIAHRIVTEHGGAIRVRPRPDGGTVFAVTLPTTPAARDAGTG